MSAPLHDQGENGRAFWHSIFMPTAAESHQTILVVSECLTDLKACMADSLRRWFAAEIIGNVVDAEPRRWRRPRKIEFRQNNDRVKRLKQRYDKFDWTGLIERS